MVGYWADATALWHLPMHTPLQSANDGVDVRKKLNVAIAKPKIIGAFRIGPSLRLVVNIEAIQP